MQIGEKYLITTDQWFLAPDGEIVKPAGALKHLNIKAIARKL